MEYPGMLGGATPKGYAPVMGYEPIPAEQFESPIASKLAMIQNAIARLEQQTTELYARLEHSVLRSNPLPATAPTVEPPPSSILWRGLDGHHERLMQLGNRLQGILEQMEI